MRTLWRSFFSEASLLHFVLPESFGSTFHGFASSLPVFARPDEGAQRSLENHISQKEKA